MISEAPSHLLVGASVELCHFSRGAITDWNGLVEGADEQTTSFRPEAAGLGSCIRHIPLDIQVTVLVDNESALTVINAWIEGSHQPSPLTTSDSDLVMDLIYVIQLRTATSSFYKVKSHRGEQFNTRADQLADKGVYNRNCAVPR